MVAHSSAAASLALGCSIKVHTTRTATAKYSSADLMELNTGLHVQLPPELKAILGRLKILRTTERRGGWWWLGAKRKQCSRKQKRGREPVR